MPRSLPRTREESRNTALLASDESKQAAGVCRMYATAAARADGLLLLCGGRDAAGVPLGDAFGLARHRDGRWEWAAAPGPRSFHLPLLDASPFLLASGPSALHHHPVVVLMTLLVPGT